MKKILIIANSDGGLFKFRKELLERLVNDYEVYLMAPQGVFTESLIDIGCNFINTNISRKGTNPFKEIGLFGFYKKNIKDIKPDFVLTYTIKPNIYGGIICASFGIPYIANITGLGTVFSNKNILQHLIVKLYRYSLRKAQKVFFQNKDNMSYMLSKNIVSGSYDLLPGSGVNVNQYLPCEYPSDEVINFLFVSRIIKEKGIDQYLEAAKIIGSKYPNTRFHICGYCDNEYLQILRQLQEEGVITYHGMIKDMIPMYHMSSCTVHPTYYPEGMSNVLLESCASARPVITTNCSGCKEIVDHGINGFLCNPKDAKDLIEKIECFLSLDYEKRRNMGLLGRKKVETDFNRTIVVDKYINEVKNG